MTIEIRPERNEDLEVIRRVNCEAFGRTGEADLVDALREAARPLISLVAVNEGLVTGHIMFSPVTIQSTPPFTAMGLAPMSVLPEHQNRGIGSMLVRRGLEECLRAGFDIVVVVGHPKYYPRFGFTPAGAKGLTCQYDVPDEVFMVAELKEQALGGRTGLVRYRPEFDMV